MTTGSSKFQQKLEERRRREAEERAKIVAETTPAFDSDLIPEDERSDRDQELDRFLNSLDILDAYRRWCGKSKIDLNSRRTEGIKISCPKPDHPDKNPSAWINTDKQVWFCGGCQEGGDSYDIAAYHFGYPVPTYKSGEMFHRLRRDMAESYGYTFISPPGIKGDVAIPPEENSSPAAPVNPDKPGQTENIGHTLEQPNEDKSDKTVVDLFDDDDEGDFSLLPDLNWREIVPKDTFLDTYMQLTSKDDIPEEYHLWHGLLALGFALGKDVTLQDNPPVYGNLFVCTLGRTGTGKSKATKYLKELLDKALPHDWTDYFSKGIRRVSAPASAEALIHTFSKPVADPANPKIILFHAPVRGLIVFNELSALVGRTSRLGNILKPALMEFYDMDNYVATVSITHGSKEAHDPYASAVTTTQPKAIRDLLTRGDADSGFLNRWVFAAGFDKEKIAIGGTHVDISPAVDPLLRIHGWAGSFAPGERIQWSPEAAELFTKFFHTTIEPDKKRDKTDLLVRMDLLTKKLILLFTANTMKKTVQVEAVEAALSMYPYIISCYSILAQSIGTSLSHEIREEILRLTEKWTKQHGTGITQRELGLRIKQKKYPIDLVAKIIKYMCDLGELDAQITKGPGRPTTRYKYVD